MLLWRTCNRIIIIINLLFIIIINCIYKAQDCLRGHNRPQLAYD